MFRKLREKKTKRLLSQTAPDERSSFHSHALRIVMERFEGHEGLLFLDLGNGTTSTLESLSEYADKVVFAAVPEQLESYEESQPAVVRSRSASTELEVPASGSIAKNSNTDGSVVPYDMVFCWDLFDYLSQDGINRLAAQIGDLTEPGSYVHLVISSFPNHRDKPSAFEICADSKVRYESGSEEIVPAPQHSLRRMIDLFSGYQVEHLGRFRSGYLEMLFRRMGAEEMKAIEEAKEQRDLRGRIRPLVLERNH